MSIANNLPSVAVAGRMGGSYSRSLLNSRFSSKTAKLKLHFWRQSKIAKLESVKGIFGSEKSVLGSLTELWNKTQMAPVRVDQILIKDLVQHLEQKRANWKQHQDSSSSKSKTTIVTWKISRLL